MRVRMGLIMNGLVGTLFVLYAGLAVRGAHIWATFTFSQRSTAPAHRRLERSNPATGSHRKC